MGIQPIKLVQNNEPDAFNPGKERHISVAENRMAKISQSPYV